jgi:phosphomevalonate kinase
VKSVSVSTPGKVVLSGEYAVLRNAPAISAAADCRAIAQLVRTENAFHRVSTPGHAAGRWRFTANDAGEINWLDEPPDQGLRLIEEAWRVCNPRIMGCLDITLDTKEFCVSESGLKFGLGGSAAAVTAFIGVLGELGPLPETTITLAHKAHKALQDGRGSGVDIATSFHGGVIEFKAMPQQTAIHRSWPDGLDYRLLWSGISADTRIKISNLESGNNDEKSWLSLSTAAEAAASAWAGESVKEILDVFDRYANALRQFGIDHDLGIFDAGHDELHDLATSFGVVYKPCGAGGGDVGIVLASDENAINRFCDAAEALGFSQLGIRLDSAGIRTAIGDES